MECLDDSTGGFHWLSSSLVVTGREGEQDGFSWPWQDSLGVPAGVFSRPSTECPLRDRWGSPACSFVFDRSSPLPMTNLCSTRRGPGSQAAETAVCLVAPFVLLDLYATLPVFGSVVLFFTIQTRYDPPGSIGPSSASDDQSSPADSGSTRGGNGCFP